MRFDRSKLEEMAALPDDKLWAQIVRIAGTYGFKLPEKTPSHEEMQKLREMALGSKISMTDAMRLLNQYKSK